MTHSGSISTLGWLFGAGLLVVLVFALCALLTKAIGRNRSPALVRLDCFLPFLRKKDTRARVARRWLGRIGPTVLSSPLRRVVQLISFVAFLWLFFYVAWPYTARPEPPGRESPGWSFDDVDQADGTFTFTNLATPDWVQVGTDVHVVHLGRSPSTEDIYVGSSRVVKTDEGRVRLQPTGEELAGQLDHLLLETGPWAFHEKPWDAWPSHYADDLNHKERWLPADALLIIDPLVSLSTSIAARSWVWSLVSAGVILIVCLIVPRGFCGYLCPLGTTIDLFDWLIGSRVTRWRVRENGWWVHIKYYVLLGVLASAMCGVLISGYFAAIPVITRAMMFVFDPLQVGLVRGWHQVPPLNAGHYFSLVLFVVVLGLGFLSPRFWCKYVCPSGAVFSVGNLFRVTQRHVETTCINCHKCVEVCPFDAIKPDYTTRVSDCTLCQTCGGVCPTYAIKFVERWNRNSLKSAGVSASGETRLGRRGFLAWLTGGATATLGAVALAVATRRTSGISRIGQTVVPVRPPGSVPESEFLQMCIRCGECFRVCPNHVLQPLGFEHGLDLLWTPAMNANWAGCESSCNACGQVCPTGAIRSLSLEEKKSARMGLAVVNEQTCLPFANRKACQLCVDECQSAGYHAIEFMQVHTQVGDDGLPLEATGFLAPVVLEDRCVGCGLCQTRCYAINVREKKLIDSSAIVVLAGPGREDRLLEGSYRELRKSARPIDQPVSQPSPKNEPSPPPPEEDDPFGLR
jgi:ferredoxin